MRTARRSNQNALDSRDIKLSCEYSSSVLGKAGAVTIRLYLSNCASSALGAIRYAGRATLNRSGCLCATWSSMYGHLITRHQVDALNNVDFSVLWPWVTSSPHTGPHLINRGISSGDMSRNFYTYTTAVGHVYRINDPQTADWIVILWAETYLQRMC